VRVFFPDRLFVLGRALVPAKMQAHPVNYRPNWHAIEYFKAALIALIESVDHDQRSFLLLIITGAGFCHFHSKNSQNEKKYR
jgi:hypothetical protein